MNARALFRRIEEFVVHNILGLDDTPRRIAVGVLLGTMIAFTPTLGFQIVIYLAAATLLGANKVSGIPILFISNPVTVVPLYYSTWKVGDYILNGGLSDVPISPEALEKRLGLSGVQLGDESLWREMIDPNFWMTIGGVIIDAGANLWVGALICGLVFGIPLYAFTLRSVKVFRKVRVRISHFDLGRHEHKEE